MQSPFMPSGVVVDAPQGYVDMCRRDASLCDDAPAFIAASSNGLHDGAVADDRLGGDDGRPKLTLASWNDGAAALSPSATVFKPDASSDAAQMDLLNRVNRFVNGNVRQRADAAVYADGDLWRRPGTGVGATGDCKDLAVEKRQELIQQGYPARNLFYAIAFRSDIGLHAVLVAHTDSGDMVLDSRTPYILAWSQAPYVWVKRQSRLNPSDWALVNGPAADASDLRVAALDMNSGNGSAPAQAR